MALRSSVRRTEPMAITTGFVEGLTSDGRGIARLNSKTVFIEGALPGEDVEFQIMRRHHRYDEAHIRNIHKSSGQRVQPLCSHYEMCGGCVLQHLSSEAQLAAKQESLLENLRRIGRVKPQMILAPLIGPIWGYRRRARLSVHRAYSRTGVHVGFVEKHSKHITDVRHCETLHPKIGHIIEPLATLIGTLSISDRIPQIEVAVGENASVLVLRLLAELETSDRMKLREFAQVHNIHFYLQPGNEGSAAPLIGERVQLSYNLPLWDLRMYFEPSDFIQVNAEINQQLVRQAIQELRAEPRHRVLDLFCGLGNFTLPLAKVAGEVVGVDGGHGLIDRARANANHNGVTNVNYYVGDLFKDQSQAVWQHQAFDRLLLDPPRAGAREILKGLGSKLPSRIVYVSCHPATLARDADYLVNDLNFEFLSAGVVDMFPHTTHVESMAVFAREGGCA